MDTFKSYKTATAALYNATPSTTGFQPEHTYEEVDQVSFSKEDIITELKAWKAQYERYTTFKFNRVLLLQLGISLTKAGFLEIDILVLQ